MDNQEYLSPNTKSSTYLIIFHYVTATLICAIT